MDFLILVSTSESELSVVFVREGFILLIIVIGI